MLTEPWAGYSLLALRLFSALLCAMGGWLISIDGIALAPCSDLWLDLDNGKLRGKGICIIISLPFSLLNGDSGFSSCWLALL